MTQKRGNNEGSIYQRKDGRWAAVLNLGYRDGSRWRKTFYGEKRSDVHRVPAFDGSKMKLSPESEEALLECDDNRQGLRQSQKGGPQ